MTTAVCIVQMARSSPGALVSSSGASKPRAIMWPMALTMPERMGYALQPRCGTSRLTCAPTVRGSLHVMHTTKLGSVTEGAEGLQPSR